MVRQPPEFDRRDEYEAVVVGAGAAGIAVAAELGRRGIGTLVIERRDGVGGSWDRRYNGLRLNTVRWLSAPRHSRIPRAAGRWPTREAFARHLRNFAERERLTVELGTEVRRVDRREDGYALETTRGPRLARFVVVATGYDRSPSIPAWPGRESFQGRLIHASEYRRAGDFQGQDVLVVGIGNTGTEIAVQLDRAGAARVRVAMRTPPNLVPLELLGIPITVLGRLGEAQPGVLSDWLGTAIQRLEWGDLSPYGLPPAPYGIGTELRVKGLGPVVDRGFVAALKEDRLEIVPAVEGFQGADVCLVDSSRIRPQVVIAATGYRMGLEPLVGHLGVLDPSGRPIHVRGEADPAAPGLFFNGLWLPMSGQLPAMRRTTRRIGRAVAGQKRREDG